MADLYLPMEPLSGTLSETISGPLSGPFISGQHIFRICVLNLGQVQMLAHILTLRLHVG